MKTIWVTLIAIALGLGCKQQSSECDMPATGVLEKTGPADSVIALAQDKLKKATGLQWSIRTSPLGDHLAYGDGQRIYFVLPVSLDEKGRRDIAIFQATGVNAKLRILGVTDHLVVLVYVREEKALSEAVTQALELRPPSVTMEEIMEQHPPASLFGGQP
jgi:hypothetical protein